jgi:hypothetical protein
VSVDQHAPFDALDEPDLPRWWHAEPEPDWHLFHYPDLPCSRDEALIEKEEPDVC